MLNRIIDISVRFRWLVVAIAVVLALFGARELLRLPIDAVPDITNRQVQITTVAPALGPEEVERQVTFPLETTLAVMGADSKYPKKLQGYMSEAEKVDARRAAAEAEASR